MKKRDPETSRLMIGDLWTGHISRSWWQCDNRQWRRTGEQALPNRTTLKALWLISQGVVASGTW